MAACGGTAAVPQVQGSAAAVETAGATTASSPSTSTPPAGPSTDDIERFFSAIASENPSKIKSVMRLTAPGTLAAAYATEQYGVTLAAEQEGNPYSGGSVVRVGSGWKSCQDDGNGGKSCSTWGDVQAQGDKIATLTVNGKSLKGRISVGSGKAVPVGALGSVTVGAAYQSVQSGALFVTFKLKAGSHSVTVDQTESAYVTKGGTQVTAEEVDGPSTLLAHAVGNYFIAFQNAPIGGHVVLKLIDQDDYSDASATLPTR